MKRWEEVKKGAGDLAQSLKAVKGLVKGLSFAVLDTKHVIGKDRIDFDNNTDKRGFFSDGPTLGNYCGGEWNAGKFTRVDEPAQEGPTLHSVDDACKVHDLGYKIAKGDKQLEMVYDAQLVKTLENLPDNPDNWERPPSKKTKDAVDAYRYWQILIFKYWKHGIASGSENLTP